MPIFFSGEKLRAAKLNAETRRRTATSVVTASSATITTTETVVLTVTGRLVTGNVYKISSPLRFTVSVTTDHHFARIREDSLTGTELQGVRLSAPTTAIGYPASIEVEYTAVSTAEKTFVVTFVRTSGTGNITMAAGSTSPIYFYVDYIR